MLKKPVKICFAFFLIIAWLYCASLPWQAQWLAKYAFANESLKFSKLNWPHTSHIITVYQNIINAKNNNSMDQTKAKHYASQAWDHAVNLNPLSAMTWLRKSQFHYEFDELQESNQSLAVAKTMGWNRVKFLKPIFVQYLVNNDIAGAKEVAIRIINASIKDTYHVFNILSKFIDEREILNEIFSNQSINSLNSRWEYFLYGLIGQTPKSKYADIVELVWDNVEDDIRQNIVNSKIVHLLLKYKAYSMLNKISFHYNDKFKYTDHPLKISFLDQDASPLCWKKPQSKRVNISESTNEDLSISQLKISFQRGWRLFNNINCYIPIETNNAQQVALTGSWSIQSKLDESYTAVNFRATMLSNKRIRSKTGYTVKLEKNLEKQEFKLNFKLNRDIKGIYIYIFRNVKKNSPTIRNEVVTINEIVLSQTE